MLPQSGQSNLAALSFRAGEGFHLIGLEFLRERIDEHIKTTVEDFRQTVQREIDAVIGDATLWKIIRADALAAIARADLQAP